MDETSILTHSEVPSEDSDSRNIDGMEHSIPVLCTILMPSLTGENSSVSGDISLALWISRSQLLLRAADKAYSHSTVQGFTDPLERIAQLKQQVGRLRIRQSDLFINL